jgi:hypothetical protein
VPREVGGFGKAVARNPDQDRGAPIDGLHDDLGEGPALIETEIGEVTCGQLGAEAVNPRLDEPFDPLADDGEINPGCYPG